MRQTSPSRLRQMILQSIFLKWSLAVILGTLGAVVAFSAEPPVAKVLQQAETAFLAADYETAQDHYSQLLESGWRGVDLLNNFAISAYANEQPGQSLAALLRANQQDFSDERIRRNLTKLLSRNMRTEGSAELTGNPPFEVSSADQRSLISKASVLKQWWLTVVGRPSPMQWLAIIGLASALSLLVILRYAKLARERPGGTVSRAQDPVPSSLGITILAVSAPLLLLYLALWGIYEQSLLRGSTVQSTTKLLSAPSAFGSTVVTLPMAQPILSEKIYPGVNGQSYRRVRVLNRELQATDLSGWVHDETVVFY